MVERDGYERFEKTVTLAERETWAETVTLKPAQAATSSAVAPERAYEGLYGGFGLVGLFGVGGQGTDLDTNCDGLSASSCGTGQPIGGGAFGYVGWTWDPVGFELMLAGSGDTLTETAHFTSSGATTTSPLALPPRDEKFTYARAGGLLALRVRASTQGRLIRATVAGGVGLSYKMLWMARTTTTTDGTNRSDVFSPTSGDSVAYISPAITLEGAVHFRVTPTVALAVGMVMWADNANMAGSNSTPAGPDRLVGGGSGPPAPIPTPGIPPGHGPAGVPGAVSGHAVRSLTRSGASPPRQPPGGRRATLRRRARAARRRSVPAPPAPPGRRSGPGPGARGEPVPGALVRSTAARSARPAASSPPGGSASGSSSTSIETFTSCFTS